ncbi:hypothetical protein RHGRI_007274 [Rhododendron griersonianum]|uniref:Hemerythrin-like domain-containing protein n=1 Tax=Rhododendron griersonianum TaxID=479676 RepID=A0AAV6KX07_9ERIC|nr:hypothetical protein RHGRI_007274 [Rhododendron griersonianum]
MGNCWGKPNKPAKKSTAEIVPSDIVKAPPKPSPAVRLTGPPTCALTCYVRFALLRKPVSLQFTPSDQAPVLHYGSDAVSGTKEALIQYIESKFPDPPLTRRQWSGGAREDDATPSVVRAAVAQHKSVVWHLERMVRWAEDLAARGGGKRVARGSDPAMGSPRMEVRKFARSYSQLLEVMLEHAQMEEKVVFPVLERADRGLSKAANEEHARDLPIMNGIKEDIKTVGVLDSGSPDYLEALYNISSRLKKLQDHCKQHFEKEERELLPLMEAAELSREQQEKVLEQCLDVMQGTHSHLFRFFMEGLLPQDALHYLDMVIASSNKERVASMLRMIVE